MKFQITKLESFLGDPKISYSVHSVARQHLVLSTLFTLILKSLEVEFAHLTQFTRFLKFLKFTELRAQKNLTEFDLLVRTWKLFHHLSFYFLGEVNGSTRPYLNGLFQEFLVGHQIISFSRLSLNNLNLLG